MTGKTNDGRPRWLGLAIGFLIGVLVGWWLLGWLIWPVSWRNTLPADLRAQERDQYLLMVAESFALNGDVNLARQRLSSWSPSEQAKVLQDLQESLLSRDPGRARQVQSLISSVVQVQGPAPAAPTARPTARPGTTAPGGAAQVPWWRQALTVLLWALLLVLGVVFVLWLWRRWRAAQAARGGPAITPAGLGRQPASAAERPATSVPGGARGEVDWSGYGREEAARPEPAMTWRSPEPVSPPQPEPTAAVEPPPYVPPPRPAQPAPEPRPAAGPAMPPRATTRPPEARPPTTPPRVSAPPARAAVKLGEYRATYQMGEPDYDEAFDISDGSGAYVGQCGLELNDPVGRNRDQAAALRVWLWDSTDPDTQESVLMSEGAYRDTAMRDQLAAAGQKIIVTRPGTQFELETHQLQLIGTIEKLEYAEQEPVYGIFAELQVRMQVFRKGK